jgi:hypothetical protein
MPGGAIHARGEDGPSRRNFRMRTGVNVDAHWGSQIIELPKPLVSCASTS